MLNPETNPQQIAQIYEPSFDAWKEIREQVYVLEHETFGDKAFTGEEL